MKGLEVTIKPTKRFHAESATTEIYQAAESLLIEQFGKESRAYEKIMKGISSKNATGSNPLFNIIVQQSLPQNKRVATLDDMIKMYSHDSNIFNGIYSDTTEIILYSKKPSVEMNTKIIENLSQLSNNQEYSSNNPLRITNLGIEKDNNPLNPYGVKFKMTDNTTMQNDKRFAHENDCEKVDFNGTPIRVYTKEQGVSGVCACGGGLNSRNDDLANLDNNGRVVVVDAEGISKKI